ncbi:hypothetical protein HOD29_02325 [archaeon]|jgi:hypothetical protein|nr:hypothetical protein [archaeon]
MEEKEYLPGNETYTIKITSPLIRPGMEIENQVSGKYLVKTLKYLFQKIRDFNNQEKSDLEKI